MAIRAASIWIFSISCFSNCVQLSHTISPYSSKGLIKVVNIISRELLSNLNLSFRIKLILFHANQYVGAKCSRWTEPSLGVYEMTLQLFVLLEEVGEQACLVYEISALIRF